MKVGLCCCFDNHNYGSMLQVMANMQAVEFLGNECEILRYVKNYSAFQRLRQAPRILNGGSLAKLKRQSQMRKKAKRLPEVAASRKARDAVFDRFSSNHFSPRLRDCVGYGSLISASTDYDAVMVGSDQLWLPIGLPTNFYNLQFVASGVRRISYATSFGVSSIPWYQRSRTADYLRKIDFLSVREDAGARICREVAGVGAKVVVDPTLLLTREEWAELIPVAAPSHKPYVFCYFLGTNPLCREEARTVAARVGLPIVTLRHLDEIVPSDEEFGDEAPYSVDPAGFVNLIRNAEIILTDSFHGTVFSAIHHKRFATFYRFRKDDRQSRNSRIDSLLSRLGMEERLVTEEGQALSTLETEADFEAVDQLLSEWRSGSWDFLKEALA